MAAEVVAVADLRAGDRVSKVTEPDGPWLEVLTYSRLTRLLVLRDPDDDELTIPIPASRHRKMLRQV